MPRVHRGSFTAAGAVAVLLSAAGQAVAQADQTAIWVDPVDGNWSDTMRWLVDSETGVAFPQDGAQTWYARVITPGSSAYTITLDLDVGITKFELTEPNATIDMGTRNFSITQDASIRNGSVVGAGGKLTVGDGSAIVGATVTGVDIDTTGTTTIGAGSFIENSIVTALSPTTSRAPGLGRVMFMAEADGDSTDSIDICNTCVDSQTGGGLGFGGTGTLNLMQGSEIINGEGSTFDINGEAGSSISSSDGSGSVENNGTIRRDAFTRGSGGGTVFIDNMASFVNNGTVEVSSGGLVIDARDQLGDFILSGGKYVVENDGFLSVINNAQELFSATNVNADVTLRGAGASFDTISSVSRIGADGRLRLEGGRNFETFDSLFVDGELSIGADSAMFVSGNGLENIEFVAPEETFYLRGGTYVVEGLLFTGSEPTRVDVIDADVTLIGTDSQFAAVNNASAVGSQGRFAIEGGRGFTVDGEFTVRDGGTLRVGAGSVFDADGIRNFSAANGSFNDGTFDIAGKLVAGNAAVREINNTVILDGLASQIVDRQGNDALEALERIGQTGTLVLRGGRSIDNLGELVVDGNLVIEPGAPAGRADQDVSQFVANRVRFTAEAGLMLLIDDDTPAAFGSLFATDTVVVDGSTLSLVFTDAYVTTLGDSFEILRATNTLDGAFGGLIVRGLGDGYAVELTYTGDALIATVVPTPAGLGVLALGGLTATRRRRR